MEGSWRDASDSRDRKVRISREGPQKTQRQVERKLAVNAHYLRVFAPDTSRRLSFLPVAPPRNRAARPSRSPAR
jgi:hypothetical protein